MQFSSRFPLILTCLLVTSLLLNLAGSGCGSSAKFRKKIELMSDDELIDYYQGIKASISDIDRGYRVDEHFNDRVQDRDEIRWRSPLSLGGKGYDLNWKQEAIEKEMLKRNIKP